MGDKKRLKDIIIFHPGYYLDEIMASMNMTQEEFAEQIGISVETVTLLLSGQTSVTKDLAAKLSVATSISAETYLNLQKSYDLKVIEV